MFSKILSATAVALASSSFVAAQTFSECNPVTGAKCKPDPALGGSVTIDFTKGPSDFFTVAGGTTLNYDPEKGAVFTINKETDAPTITSNKYIFFGKVEIECMASVGVGIVTSAVLQSDDLDEIDWEWLGGDAAQVQTNYFSKGDTTSYTRGGFSPVTNPQSGFHTYTIDWTPQAVNWLIDGKNVRTLTYEAAGGGKEFPQTPMQVKLGTWVGGSSKAAEGTVQWAGGRTDFGAAPFQGFYKRVTVTDYSNGVKGATSYSYGDASGSYTSIKISTDGNNNNAELVNITSSSTASSTSSGSSAPTTMITSSVSSNSTTGSGSGSNPGKTGGSAPTTSPTTVPNNSGVRSAGNFVAVGATFLLTYLIL